MVKQNDLFDRILNTGPSQETLFLLLSKMKDEGRVSEVIREGIKALNVHPNDIHIRSLLAESYLEAGFIGPAEAELGKIAFEIDSLSSIFKIQGKIFIRQKRTSEAVEAIRRFLAHNPDDQEALDLMDKIMPSEIKQRAEIPETLEKADLAKDDQEEVIPDLSTPTLAEIYFKQGLVSEAIDTYERIISEHPDDNASIKRLAELKTLNIAQSETKPEEKDGGKETKKKMIAILEGWLLRIQELKHV